MATRLGKRQIALLQLVQEQSASWHKDTISSAEFTTLERLDELGYIRLTTTTQMAHFRITESGREALKAVRS